MGKNVIFIEHDRNAENGKYVSIEYTKNHPKTTIIERDKVKEKK